MFGNFSNIWSWVFLCWEIYIHTVSLCIYLPVIRSDEDCTLFGNETLPNNDWRRIIHFYAFSFVGSLRNTSASGFACHSQLFFICAFSCTYFLFKDPLFTYCSAKPLRPGQKAAVLCQVAFWLTPSHLVYLSFPLITTSHLLLGKLTCAGCSLFTCLITESWLTCPNNCTIPERSFENQTASYLRLIKPSKYL